MSEAMERAHETIEEHGRHAEAWSRRVAVLVAALAAVMAMTEIGGKAAQVLYLTNHIALSDDWAFYQAKNLRASVWDSQAALLSSLPNAQDPVVQERIKAARAQSTRMRDDPEAGDGMKQLAAKAKAAEIERDAAGERYHAYEYAVGALEIAIVLASVSVVTRVRALAIAAACIGAAATIASLCVAANLF